METVGARAAFLATPIMVQIPAVFLSCTVREDKKKRKVAVN
jgi:hypothetical protein